MTPLRRRMIKDMRTAGLASGTQAPYLDAVRNLAAHYRSPDELSEEEMRVALAGAVRPCPLLCTASSRMNSVTRRTDKPVQSRAPGPEQVAMKRRRQAAQLRGIGRPDHVAQVVGVASDPESRVVIRRVHDHLLTAVLAARRGSWIMPRPRHAKHRCAIRATRKDRARSA
jgi:hypothetical protein